MLKISYNPVDVAEIVDAVEGTIKATGVYRIDMKWNFDGKFTITVSDNLFLEDFAAYAFYLYQSKNFKDLYTRVAFIKEEVWALCDNEMEYVTWLATLTDILLQLSNWMKEDESVKVKHLADVMKQEILHYVICNVSK